VCCGRVLPSLVNGTFLLLDRDGPCARVNPKRIKLSYSFGSESTQIRNMGVKKLFSSPPDLKFVLLSGVKKGQTKDIRLPAERVDPTIYKNYYIYPMLI